MAYFHSQNGGYLLRVKYTIVCLTEAHERENTKFIYGSLGMVSMFLEASEVSEKAI